MCTTPYYFINLKACKILIKTYNFELKDNTYFLFVINEDTVSQLFKKLIINILLYLNVGLVHTKYLNKNGDYI